MASVEILLIHAVSPAGASQNRKALDWIKRLGCQNTATDSLFFFSLSLFAPDPSTWAPRKHVYPGLEAGDSQGQSSDLANPAEPESPGVFGEILAPLAEHKSVDVSPGVHVFYKLLWDSIQK